MSSLSRIASQILGFLEIDDEANWQCAWVEKIQFATHIFTPVSLQTDVIGIMLGLRIWTSLSNVFREFSSLRIVTWPSRWQARIGFMTANIPSDASSDFKTFRHCIVMDHSTWWAGVRVLDDPDEFLRYSAAFQDLPHAFPVHIYTCTK